MTTINFITTQTDVEYSNTVQTYTICTMDIAYSNKSSHENILELIQMMSLWCREQFGDCVDESNQLKWSYNGRNRWLFRDTADATLFVLRFRG